MIEYCDEMYDVYRRERRRARKPHDCDECNRTIAPGESYRWYSGLYDGTWSTHRICQHCGVAVDWLTRECGGIVHHGVEEDIKDHAEEYASFALWRLYVGIRDAWRRGEGLRPVPSIPAVTADQ